MSPNARVLRERLTAAQAGAKLAAQAVANLEYTCTHRWDPTVEDPIIKPGYNDPSAGYGHGYSGLWVHEQRIPRWRRECEECGKVEYTTETKSHTTTTPRFA